MSMPQDPFGFDSWAADTSWVIEPDFQCGTFVPMHEGRQDPVGTEPSVSSWVAPAALVALGAALVALGHALGRRG